MKKTIVAIAFILCAGTFSSYAQGGGGGFQMPTPEERVKRVHFKIDSAFKLDETKMKQVDDLFLNYYKKQDEVRQEMMGGGGGFQAMQEAMKPHQEELDTKLKPILGDDNFKVWKEQVEPTMMRRRGGPPRQ